MMTPFHSFKINNTVNDLCKASYIPATGLFDISEEMLQAYIRLYKLHSKGNGKFEQHYARKVAGMMLLLLKLYRGDSYKTAKEGLVYLISNPAWPEHIKIGMSLDINKRLKSLQTGDPLRQYKIEGYEFVLDRRSVEKDVLNNYSLNLEQGEWIKVDNVLPVIRYIRTKHTPMR